MKDASSAKRSRPNSDLEENDSSKRGSDSNNKAEKHKRKKLRKRQSTSSPEEDIIDGFVIASYSNLRCLEVVSSNTPDQRLPSLQNEQNEQPVEESSKVQKIEEELPRPTLVEGKEEAADLKTSEIAVVRENSNGIKVSHTEIELSRQSPGQLTDDSSDSGNSGKGYICDGESEDELVLEEKKPLVLKSSLTSVTEAKKEIIPIKVDLSKDDDSVKSEKPFSIGSDTPKSISSPKSSSFHTPSISFSSSSSLAITQSSRPLTPQSSWLPRLSSSSFKKPMSVIEPCCGSTSYSGPDALHQELNNRFLQSHSGLDRNSQHSKAAGHEMHQHSHLHHHQHQHQHQHTHYYPSPLLGQPYYPTPTPVVSRPGVMSPFSTPVPTYGGSHVMSPFNRKTGKWCAAHVQIAWKIYCHQREKTEMSKDPHTKPEQISISKPSSTIIPPYPSRHMSPSDLGYPSPHLHSSRFSGSPFGKPPVLIGRSSAANAAVTSSISAFSSVSSPPARRTASPDVIPRVSSSSGIHGKRSPSSGPSTLYPWLKSEPPELDKEKPIHTKREFQSKSPARPIHNFSIQALAGERSDTIRPSPLGSLDSTRTHSSREHRPCETRPFMDNPLLTGFDKRPMDYGRPTTGSIDLNRNTLYRQFDPMHALYSHHVTPLTSHVAGYHYPGSPFLTDYHSGVGAPGHGMVLGTRDPMSSLVRTPDTPFYMRHDFNDRMGGRH